MNTKAPARHLVLAPHHDDEVIGCGGSIAKATVRGEVVRVIVMTSGELSGVPGTREEQIALREAECRRACQVLGVESVIFMREPDRSLTYRRDLVDRLVNEIADFRPDIVYFPHEGEADREHRVVAEIAREAAMLAPSRYSPAGKPAPRIRLLLQYEVWTPMATYQVATDISTVMDIKLEALRCYESQLQHVRLDNAIEGLNKYRGVQSGKGSHAEIFLTVNR